MPGIDPESGPSPTDIFVQMAPEAPLYDQPWNLAQLLKAVIQHEEKRVSLKAWRRYHLDQSIWVILMACSQLYELPFFKHT